MQYYKVVSIDHGTDFVVYTLQEYRSPYDCFKSLKVFGGTKFRVGNRVRGSYDDVSNLVIIDNPYVDEEHDDCDD